MTPVLCEVCLIAIRCFESSVPGKYLKMCMNCHKPEYISKKDYMEILGGYPKNEVKNL